MSDAYGKDIALDQAGVELKCRRRGRRRTGCTRRTSDPGREYVNVVHLEVWGFGLDDTEHDAGGE